MEPEATQGQAETADLAETTAPAPEGDSGQSTTPVQTTESGPDDGAQGESFFDPKSIEHSPELVQAYKQMQRSFTKSKQQMSAEQAKIDAYNQAIADPVGTARQLAQQYGYTMVQGGPQPEADQAEFNPGSWDDVIARAKQEAVEEVRREYEPLLGEVKSLKQQNIEQYLDTHFLDWRTYESEMIRSLQKHPSMAEDPDALYRMSVPPEVWEARATERALKRLKTGADSGAVPGVSKATSTTSEKPTGPLSFNDAVKFAKRQLSKQGVTGPVGG
jgi:hypothetical protein